MRSNGKITPWAGIAAILCVGLGACEQATHTNDTNEMNDTKAVVGNEMDGVNIQTAEPNVAIPQTPCTSVLRVEADHESFDGGVNAEARLTPESVEALRVEAERQFKTVTDQMCAAGELPANELGAFRRLLIQNADGASNAAIYGDSGTYGPETLVFQYTFDLGEGAATLELPTDEDLRSGLICWNDPAGNEAMCRDREP